MEDADSTVLLSKALACARKFENLVAELYGRLSQRVDDRWLPLVFRWLSRESSNHADFIENLRQALDLRDVETDCEEFVGEPWRVVSSAMNSLPERVDVGLKDFRDLLYRLFIVEEFVGEETYSKLLYPLLTELLRSAGTNLEELKLRFLDTLFKELSEEEDFHEELVRLALDYCSKR